MRLTSIVVLTILLLSFPAAGQKQPVPADSELQQGGAAYLNHRYEEAVRHFQKAIELDPSLPDAHHYLAAALVELGNSDESQNLSEAEHQFRRAIEADSSNYLPRAALVRLFIREGKKDEAESFLRQTKKDLPDSPEGYRMLGDYYFAMGDLDKASSEYASLYRDHPDDKTTKQNYIQILILQSRFDEATKLNDETLKTNPQDVTSLVYRGQVQIGRGNSNAAVDSLQAALRNEPANAVAHYQLGRAFDQQHDESRAESEWREALRLRPDLTAAKSALDGLELERRDSASSLSTNQIYVPAGISQGLLINKIAPTYPQDARKARIQGAVILQAQISKTGEIENLQLISGDPMLAAAAIKAVKQWKYKPYLINGEPVDVKTQVQVNFELHY